MTTLTLVLVTVLVTCLGVSSASYCGPPDTPNHGGFYPQRKFYSIGKKVEFYCPEKYYLDGVKSTVCTYDKKTGKADWADPSPSCKPITCPDLEDPTYGFVEETGNRVGDKATYHCDYGFVLHGESKRYCQKSGQKSGQWSGQAPTCVPITCPDLADPQYGSVELSGNRVGDTADYECDFGFYLSGDSQRVCLSSGAWSGEAPTCVAITCPDLEDPKYGSVDLSGNRVGDNADYQCDSGFELDGDSSRECQESGEWSSEAPACVPILCPDLEDPADGSVETTDNRVGDVANYECNFGFNLVGDSQRTCLLSGDWSSEAPTCVAITCPDLEDPKYGSVELTGNRVGDEADYECDYGFRLKGDSQRECLTSGDWSGEAPTCVPITCPDLKAPLYGSVKLTGNKVGDYANYKCDYGFRLEGVTSRKCLVSGEWSGDGPICVRIKCPDLDDPKFGSVVLTGNKVGDKATYKCDYGYYTLVGESQRKCLATGEWSGKAPVCERYGKPHGGYGGHRGGYDDHRGGYGGHEGGYGGHEGGYGKPRGGYGDCDRPKAPQYGKVRYSSISYGSRAYYSCPNGYHLRGNSYRVCNSYGKWGGHAPSCESYDYRGDY